MSDIAPYRDATRTIDKRADDLLGRMTLAEKIDQLHQCGVGDTNPNNLRERADEFRPTYGSFILNGPEDRALRDELQCRCVEKSRLGIPAIFGADVIHGYRTIFPIPLAQACAWSPELVRKACRNAAQEARAAGVDWTFAPMIDVCVDPRWGRIAETFGESPCATGEFCRASVEGYQGERLDADDSVAACLKHFVGYGASEGGRDYSYTDISPQRLWEMHLPPFEAGVRAGARTVMSAFNDLNGVPASAHRELLTNVLRGRWDFNGFVVSDWNAELQLINQGFAADDAEAGQRAIKAGVDMNMADGIYRRFLASLVERGELPVAVIDDAVRRVLRVKFELGLFERPYAGRASRTSGVEDRAAAAALSEELAGESIVLLENRGGVLPLSASVRRIAMIGPLATERAGLLGSWPCHGRLDEVTTLLDGLRERALSGMEVGFVQGCTIEGDERDGLAEAVALAKASDIVVLCLGESERMSGENASRSTLRLPGVQEELTLAIATTGRPVVLVLVSGRPIELHAIEARMAAILAVWQPGTRGAAAVADILLGHRSPSGRLAVTWPRTTGQIPLHHTMRPRARRGREGGYQDIETTPLYEFGHGLGFTRFEYGPIRLDRESVKVGETLIAEVTVTNCGQRDGAETVFWFVRDPAASITRPLRELKHFEKAMIPAGVSREFRFAIDPMRDLAFPDANGRPVLEAGEIILMAGAQSARFLVGSL
jgi:beta-glucosidase